MNKEIADKWVKALRSNEYEQTTNCLEDSEGFCCLGVLCDLAKKDDVEVIMSDGIIYGVCLDEQLEVKGWAGIKTADGRFSHESNDKLTILNDVDGLSFEQIADTIEKNVENL